VDIQHTLSKSFCKKRQKFMRQTHNTHKHIRMHAHTSKMVRFVHQELKTNMM